jgi:hypothetical protein
MAEVAMPAKRDAGTIDLFSDYAPGPVVERFAPERVRAVRLGALLAQAVAETLREQSMPRAEIAKAMSDYLGERVTEAMLNQYSSQANDKHNIPAHRLVALAVVTGDARLLNALCGEVGLIAVPEKYEALMRRELAREAAEKLTREANAADAQWRAAR